MKSPGADFGQSRLTNEMSPALGTLFSALTHDGLMDMARLNEASAEIIDAVRRIVADGIAPDALNEELFSHYLYTADLPDPETLVKKLQDSPRPPGGGGGGQTAGGGTQ